MSSLKNGECPHQKRIKESCPENDVFKSKERSHEHFCSKDDAEIKLEYFPREISQSANIHDSKDNDQCLIDCGIASEFFNLDLSRFGDGILGNATLQQALEFFDFPNLLKELDHDLGKVKKEINSKKDHEMFFNQKVNDSFRRLSTKYHPDRVSNRGCTEDDVARATEIQKVVNLVWSILKMLYHSFVNSSYLSDQDFEYSTCSTVEITILSNEERLKNLNNKILIELCWLSRIKHEKMIPNINKFLKHSHAAIRSFIRENYISFEEEKKKALIYFNLYFSGYEELFDALENLMENCKRDKDLAYIKSSVQLMFVKSLKNCGTLYEIRNNYLYKYQNVRSFHRYVYPEADKDLVQPFIAYLELIFKCTCMMRKDRRTGTKGIQRKAYQRPVFQIGEIQKKFKMKDMAHRYCLFHKLVGDYCTGINSIATDSLKEKFCINVSTNEAVTKFLIIEILKLYFDYLQNEFLPIKVSSEYDIGAVKKNVENVLQEFTSTMRETAKKGLQEIKTMQNKMKEDFFQMEEEFKATIKNTEEENARKIKDMEQKLKQANEIERRIEERIRKEVKKRTNLELKLRENIKRNSRTEEQKLRRQSRNLEEETETRIFKRLEEIADMKNQLEMYLEEEY